MASQAGTRTTCPYCGVGCGVIAGRAEDGTITIAGDPRHPANYGRLCAKGAALAETLIPRSRLRRPSIAGAAVSWDSALDRVAHEFSCTIAEHGPDAVAFYVSGQLLTEDYYVANKLMKGFIGSANIDTNSRLCMASSVAGHKRAFGEDIVPGVYEDFELADMVVLVGSNLAWCHPVLHQRLLAARARRGTRIVVIDPRATASCEQADMHLPLRSGSDVALFNGLLHHIERCGALDVDYIAAHTTGFEQASAAAAAFDLAEVSRVTGLDRTAIVEFYEWFVACPRSVTAYSQGVNQSSAGTDKVNAIINCHLATARIGQPGAGPFSLTGQPNAMGGREVGGLSNNLAAHLEFGVDAQHALLAEFWNAPRLAAKPGLKAVDLFRAVGKGRIKALWIMATNPLVSLPQADAVRDALAACPFVVVSDITADSELPAMATVLLPAAGWSEKDGTVTNSERRISRQRAFLAPPGAARPDWWIVCEVAKRMGFGAAFDFTGPDAIFREHARLIAVANDGRRRLDLGALADVDARAYAALAPTLWPCPARGVDAGAVRLFGDGRFATPDGRARFVATTYRAPATRADAARDLILNTGRIRDQWHTMTRTGLVPRLASHFAEPHVEIHPATAARLGVAAAELLEITDGERRIVARALITDRQRADALFVPMHWSTRHAGSSMVNRVVQGSVDPISGQPELKHTPVGARRYAAAWYGFAAIAGTAATTPPLDYWARMHTRAGWRYELAHAVLPEQPEAWFAELFVLSRFDELAIYCDAPRGVWRFAAFARERLQGALFVAAQPVAVARTWLCNLLGERIAPALRGALLAGAPAASDGDTSAVVCTCHQIGRASLERAIARGHQSLAAIAGATAAGSGCGACRFEIQRMIDAGRTVEVA